MYLNMWVLPYSWRKHQRLFHLNTCTFLQFRKLLISLSTYLPLCFLSSFSLLFFFYFLNINESSGIMFHSSYLIYLKIFYLFVFPMFWDVALTLSHTYSFGLHFCPFCCLTHTYTYVCVLVCFCNHIFIS